MVDPPNLDQASSPTEEVQYVEEKANDSSVDGRQVADEREIVVETTFQRELAPYKYRIS